MPKIVSIIPARGGSKGIPRKNLVNINGKPLIYYVIRASLNSDVDETWVSSEDQKILEVAKRFKARVLKRPEHLATDESSSESVLFHFAKYVDFDILIFLQATCPFTLPEDINKSIKLLKEYDSVLTVTSFTQFTWRGNKPNYDIYHRGRRQNSEPTYLETGALFATTRDNLFKYRNRIGGKIGFCIVPKIRSFDIDTYEDLELIRKLMACKEKF